MDFTTFHTLYGCFGVRAIKRNGRYVYNKTSSNQIRVKVQAYLFRKPSRAELLTWLKNQTTALAQYHTKQSIQIGIITALQSQHYTGQEIYGLLNDLYGGLAKGRNYNDIALRNNSAKYRQSVT